MRLFIVPEDYPREPIVAPLIPLPIVDSLFERVAMNIDGRLLWSHSGKRFLLVVCDNCTRVHFGCNHESGVEGLRNDSLTK